MTGEQAFNFGPVANGTQVAVPGNSLTLGGGTFSGNNLTLADNTAANFSAFPGFPGTYLRSQTSAATADVITITFGTPVDAVGFNFGNHNRNNNKYQFQFSTGDTFTEMFNQIDNPLFFFGIVSTIPITSVTITDEALTTGDTSNTDIDLTGFRTADPVPEPATVALLGSGLLWLGVMRRRRHRAQ